MRRRGDEYAALPVDEDVPLALALPGLDGDGPAVLASLWCDVLTLRTAQVLGAYQASADGAGAYYTGRAMEGQATLEPEPMGKSP